MKAQIKLFKSFGIQIGLHYSWPWPFETHNVIAIDLVRRLEFGLPPKPSRETATRALVRAPLFRGSAGASRVTRPATRLLTTATCGSMADLPRASGTNSRTPRAFARWWERASWRPVTACRGCATKARSAERWTSPMVMGGPSAGGSCVSSSTRV